MALMASVELLTGIMAKPSSDRLFSTMSLERRSSSMPRMVPTPGAGATSLTGAYLGASWGAWACWTGGGGALTACLASLRGASAAFWSAAFFASSERGVTSKAAPVHTRKNLAPHLTQLIREPFSHSASLSEGIQSLNALSHSEHFIST